MASIVQSTLHMSAKASVAKTESLKRQRSVKSVSRTSNVTFASSEETVDRRHAMSLFAVRLLRCFFFFVFLSAIRLQNSLFSSSKRDDDASLSFRKSKNPTSMRTLDRSDERAFARDDKILEAINIDFERTGLKRAAAAADRNFCSRICSSFCESFLGGKTRFYLSYPPISSLGESSLANKNLTKCISRNPPF